MIAAAVRFLVADRWRSCAVALACAFVAVCIMLLGARAATMAQKLATSKVSNDLANLKTDHAEAMTRASASALTTYLNMERKKDAALQLAEARNAQLTLDARRARAAADGLQRDLADVPARIAAATAAASHEAVAEYAAAASVVFDQCVRKYHELAEVADGHASDVRTLSEAWPVDDAGTLESSPPSPSTSPSP